MIKIKYIISIVIIGAIVSCSQKKNIIQFVNHNYKCLDSLSLNIMPDKAGPIKVRIQVDTIIISGYTKAINLVTTVTVDKESKLIRIGDSVVLKVFHTESIQYGKLRHWVKYDVFIKYEKTWKRKSQGSFSTPSFYDKNFTRSWPNTTTKSSTKNYFTVIMNVSRIK